ncbi:riboflavin biosynthesis protein RibF [Arachidicoccus ginsenosidimutans]|uniref:bifunctional riboflavin kinase/FAD synthetase n=1 Tax=Arachidicoccus sp. BS20 TaxID=1850526 RepID=UPI0007F051EC|nr:bifunctional riboflavin kinase/FAD synthetase [Arachidicoccus sp. BS20]ANI89584.1 riboflavin biosynthesis protein RibF [Arachidicoccus sp. BS20]
MRVFYDLENLPLFNNAVVTIGTFDGVHLGHQKIIHQLKDEAKQIAGETVIVTFHPHPRKIVQQNETPLRLLNTLNEKLSLLKKHNVENVIVVPFNEAFASQTAEEYVQDFLVKKIHPHTIIIGYDHRFGKGRTGDYHTLESYGKLLNFRVKEIPEKLLNEVTISSTKIREALLHGDIATVTNFLGYPYFLQGTVVKGNQIGRTIGYPTANIQVEDADKLIPAIGVYAVKVIVNEAAYGGMLGISLRPTIEESTRISIEVNIFDFAQDIYGKNIKVELLAWLRSEEKFNGLDALKAALAKDEEDAREILNKIITIIKGDLVYEKLKQLTLIKQLNWENYYLDEKNNEKWIEEYPNSFYQGGGEPQLRKLDKFSWE